MEQTREQTIETTKSRLVCAFMAWNERAYSENSDFSKTPEKDFLEASESEKLEMCERQAQYLIDELEKLE